MGSSKYPVQRRISFAAVAFLCFLAVATEAQTPCCSITSIDARADLVFAKVNATGQGFQFKPNSPALLSSIKVGEGLYANFRTRQVSLDGKTICGTLVAVSSSPSPEPATPVLPKPSPPSSAPVAKPSQPGAPVGEVTSIDAANGIVTAKISSSGQTFQFRVTVPALLKSLKIGQGVFANFSRKEISLDGETVSGSIVAFSQGTVSQGDKPIPRSASTVPTIQSFTINGPVTGGNSTAGVVQLTGPALTSLIINLTSNNSQVASVPATVSPTSGFLDKANFTVNTQAVTNSTYVNLTAQGPNDPSPIPATLNVLPVMLSGLACYQGQVPAGTPVVCQVSLTGPLGANQTVSANLTSSDPVNAPVPANVTIDSLHNSATFTISTQAIAQDNTVKISAAYNGASVSTTFRMLTAAIESFACSSPASPSGATSSGTDCDVYPDRRARPPLLEVTLTAPAPAGGFSISITPPVPGGGLPGDLRPDLLGRGVLVVPAGQKSHAFPYPLQPVVQQTTIPVIAQDPLAKDTRATRFIVHPPILKTVSFAQPSISGVPLGGQKVYVAVEMTADVPTEGLVYLIRCGGSTDISCPHSVRVLERIQHFSVTVNPCNVNPPCQVLVNMGGFKATLTVSP